MKPEWEYLINAFDVAVRDVYTCECEQGQCEHVDVYNKAREALVIAFLHRDGQLDAYESYRRNMLDTINSFGSYVP